MLTHPCWKWIAGAMVASGPLLASPPAPPAPPAPPTAPATPGPGLAHFLAQQGYVPMRVDISGRNEGLVQVRINGVAATLALDTGCGRTCITHRFARELKLDILKSDPMQGVGGALAGGGLAILHSFTLNNFAIIHADSIPVLPSRASAPADGLLGYDVMRLNSILLPVGANFLLYKQSPGPAPEIDAYLEAWGYRAIPLTPGEGGLRAAGNLDGHPLVAIVDSGAKKTVFDSDFVKMTVGALVADSRMIYWGIDGRPMYVGVFEADRLTLGGMTLPPTQTTTASVAVLEQTNAQALLGYDLLARHKAIIDLGHDVLWMK